MNTYKSLRIGLVLLIALALVVPAGFAQTKVTINYPTRSGASWPLYIAKEGGYYQKYGIDANIVFGVHPAGVAMLVSGEAQMVNHSLEQGMQAAVKDGQFVIVGSPGYKGYFALMAQKDIKSIGDLKGKRLAVGQVGDAPYNYTNALLQKFKLGVRDVQWIPVGTDVNGRVAALTSNRAEATLLTAPAYFRLEESGYKNLGNLADFNDIFIATGYLFRKSAVQANPKLPELIIKAHTEAIKRFYEDKAFAIKAYMAFDKQPEADLSKIYDRYKESNGFERVPYVMAAAVKAVVSQQSDATLAAQMKAFDFKTVIDNSIVERLVKEKFFEGLFGPSIKAEEDRKAKLAFK
jgi:ABC-type nitrate/sulfonate/bicarbonate transport system substrate-binding protein